MVFPRLIMVFSCLDVDFYGKWLINTYDQRIVWPYKLSFSLSLPFFCKNRCCLILCKSFTGLKNALGLDNYYAMHIICMYIFLLFFFGSDNALSNSSMVLKWRCLSVKWSIIQARSKILSEAFRSLNFESSCEWECIHVRLIPSTCFCWFCCVDDCGWIMLPLSLPWVYECGMPHHLSQISFCLSGKTFWSLQYIEVCIKSAVLCAIVCGVDMAPVLIVVLLDSPNVPWLPCHGLRTRYWARLDFVHDCDSSVYGHISLCDCTAV